jgi:hypothetical protein
VGTAKRTAEGAEGAEDCLTGCWIPPRPGFDGERPPGTGGIPGGGSPLTNHGVPPTHSPRRDLGVLGGQCSFRSNPFERYPGAGPHITRRATGSTASAARSAASAGSVESAPPEREGRSRADPRYRKRGSQRDKKMPLDSDPIELGRTVRAEKPAPWGAP